MLPRISTLAAFTVLAVLTVSGSTDAGPFRVTVPTALGRILPPVPGFKIPTPTLRPDPRDSQSRPPWVFGAGTSPQPGDEYWWDGFGLPTPDGWVNCTAEYSGGLVVGGRFTRIGDVLANNIAFWNGSHWTSLGTGIEGDVLSLRVFQGDLIAAGRFSQAGGNEALGVARWTGSAWEPVGSGLYRPLSSPPDVARLEIFRGDLIAGGYFTNSGTTEVRHMARWDGTQWAPLGAGLNGPPYALGVLRDTLFAGGYFDSAGTVSAYRIARWDGSDWSALGAGVPPGNNEYIDYVSEMCAYRGELIVGGYFGGASPGLAIWSGTDWRPMGDGLGYGPTAMGVHQDSLFVGVYYGLSVWDGNSWAYVPGIEGSVGSVDHYQSDLLLAGPVIASSPEDGHPLALQITRRTNNSSWTPLEVWTENMHGLTQPPYGLVSSLAVWRDKVMAAGGFQCAGNPPDWTRTGAMATWDGGQWSSVPSSTQHQSRGILAHGDSLYSYGWPYPGLGTAVSQFQESWWAPLDTLSLDATCLAFYRGSLVVGGVRGSYPYAAGEVYRWDGSHWVLIASMSSSYYPYVAALLEAKEGLVVGGLFDHVNGIPAVNVAAWDGAEWRALGIVAPVGPEYGTVRALAVHQGYLVAGRDSYGPEGVIARWDGTQWRPLGDLKGYPFSLMSAGSELYVGGSLITEEEPYRGQGAMRWNGHEWQSLGSGLNGSVRSFAAHDGSLYMGGFFTEAGGHGSFGIARWDGLRSVLGAPRVTLAPGVPNPFHTSSVFGYRLAVAGPVRISVHDVRGREVQVIESSSQAAGDHTVTWDGRGRDGRRVPTGVYFVRVQLPNGIEKTRKAVLLR